MSHPVINLEECDLCHDYVPVSEICLTDQQMLCLKCRTIWTANTTLPGGIDKDGLSTKEHTQNGKLGGES